MIYLVYANKKLKYDTQTDLYLPIVFWFSLIQSRLKISCIFFRDNKEPETWIFP